MLTVKNLHDVLDEMRSIYNYKDAETLLYIDNEPCRMDRSLIRIETKDKRTGIHVCLVKDGAKMDGGAEWA